ncbi:galactoside alpha-(1,2)-fucosyltransferase 2-like [Haliotis cracherodii]|uniref:galactoside alpha-(1,2)-fucosyltransferase 2-like n=1 Tax=Haliotis cracherodii TaxID=6455 RepID=UPI0039E9DEE8
MLPCVANKRWMPLGQPMKILGVVAIYMCLAYGAFLYKKFSWRPYVVAMDTRQAKIMDSQVQNENKSSTIPKSATTMIIGGKTQSAVTHLHTSIAASNGMKHGVKPGEKTWKEMPILTPQFIGRLGNTMFEYASTYALARATNKSLYIARSNALNRLFPLDSETVTFQGCGGWQPVSAPCCLYDPQLATRLDSRTCQSVGGYLQSWKFFHPVEESIRRQFTFKPSITDKAAKKLFSVSLEFFTRMKDASRMTKKLSNATEDLKQDGHRILNVSTTPPVNLTYIGVHVRRGDYIGSISIRQGRTTPPAEYYIHAMNYFRAIYPNALFVVGGDDRSWVNRNIAAVDVVVLQRELPEVDLCVLSMCNHTVMSVGSFGWWAGFLAGGTTVYYKHPFRNNTSMSKWYAKYHTEFAYPGWIPMI